MLFGERLSLLRNERQMKQEDLGKIFHLSKSTISTYERNEHQPDYDTLIELAKYFNVSTDYILGVSDQRRPLKILKSSFYNNCSFEKILNILQELTPSARKTAYEVITSLEISDKLRK